MPNFAKRHYEQIALAMQEARMGADNVSGPVALDRVASELARVFQNDNPQFNRERFLRACVPGADVRARKAA